MTDKPTTTTEYLTAAGWLQEVADYVSILQHRGMADVMSRSIAQREIQAGEIDPDDYAQAPYNPLASAGYFGIICAFDRAWALAQMDVRENKRRELSGPEKLELEKLSDCLVQLIFAAMDEADSLAKMRAVVRGSRSIKDIDQDRAPEMCAYLRRVVHYSRQWVERVAAGDLRTPLDRTDGGSNRQLEVLEFDAVAETEE